MASQEGELSHDYWQYTFVLKVKDLKIGVACFLKSNPEIVLHVISRKNGGKIIVVKVLLTGRVIEMPIECLMTYKYRCLMNDFKKRIFICLN